MTKEDIIEFLSKVGVKAELINIDEYGFSREIAFRVYDVEYRIIWFHNEATLRIGIGHRAACLPFRYMYYDTTYPLVMGNKSIGFSYTKNKKEGIFDREFPYEVLRIPLEIENI